MDTDIFVLPLDQIVEILNTGKLDTNIFRAALLQRMADVSAKKDTCQAQITQAKQKAAANKEYSDIGWYRRALDARNHCAREHQRLQGILGMLNNYEKSKRCEHHDVEQKGFDAAFKRAAKMVLDVDTYKKICRVANELAE